MINSALVDFRASKIGGSDVSTLLGRGYYAGPASIQQRILYGTQANKTKYKAEFEFGNRWETQVAQLFAENHANLLVVSVQDAWQQGWLHNLMDFKARIVQLEGGVVTLLHPDHDFLVLNIDYLLIDRNSSSWGVLEIKTASEFSASQWENSGTPDGSPYWYQDQPKHYAHCIGGMFAYTAVLIGQRDYREYPMGCYSTTEGEENIQTLVDWYQRHVIKEEPVRPTFKDFGQVSITQKAVQATSEDMELVREHARLSKEIKKLQEQLEPIDKSLRGKVATASTLLQGKKPIFKHSASERTSFDQGRLARERPDLYAQYSIKQTRHVFSKAVGYHDLQKTA